jgi:hypothetical protein
VSPWKVILATLVIFTTGLITGGMMVRQFPAKSPPRAPRLVENSIPPEPWMLRMELLGRMQRELNLNAAQHERIRKILEDSRENWRVLWDIMGPEIRSELNHVRAAIHEELEPEQRQRFEALLQQRPRRLNPVPALEGNPPFRGPRQPDDFQPQPGQGQPRFQPNTPPRPQPFNRNP